MFDHTGTGDVGLSQGTYVADGEVFEIRYVDSQEAALWASERGYLFAQEDLPPAVVTYFD